MADRKQTLVDINKASMDELLSIRGIGTGLAAQIIEKRPYADLHELIEVSGINETKLAALLPFITLGTQDRGKPAPEKTPTPTIPKAKKPVSTLGGTEAFVFFEDRNERQDALLMVLGGFILGLLILMLRRRK